MAKYSISAASRITGKSRTTLSKHIKQGKLSCERDESGQKMIDASELARAYAVGASDFEREEGRHEKSETGLHSEQSKTDQSVQQLATSVQQQLDIITQERERERAHFQQQVEQLEEALKRSQDAQSKALLLLENKSGVGEWEVKLKSLEGRIANQEETNKKRLAMARERAKREAEEEFGRLPFWRKLFG